MNAPDDEENGWWVNALDPKYNEKVYGVKFEKGIAFIPEKQHNAPAIVNHMLDDLLFAVKHVHYKKVKV
jgi:hypothetical protein